ncbi:hypothetical protein BDY21DRAFT_209739 [Lineolata rhizophorae]|uniref:Uncharacterized protein n=1 Tax=Lineolata rhizophorae TaxID=578093 RepID=A0A6A6P495_9PEZI|nr:hypothetical protein BDY21DRAFT_209739 [Lineolata rhizophorae]
MGQVKASAAVRVLPHRSSPATAAAPASRLRPPRRRRCWISPSIARLCGRRPACLTSWPRPHVSGRPRPSPRTGMPHAPGGREHRLPQAIRRSIAVLDRVRSPIAPDCHSGLPAGPQASPARRSAPLNAHYCSSPRAGSNPTADARFVCTSIALSTSSTTTTRAGQLSPLLLSFCATPSCLLLPPPSPYPLPAGPASLAAANPPPGTGRRPRARRATHARLRWPAAKTSAYAAGIWGASAA